MQAPTLGPPSKRPFGTADSDQPPSFVVGAATIMTSQRKLARGFLRRILRHAALPVVDVQRAFLDGARPVPRTADALRRIVELTTHSGRRSIRPCT